MNPVSTRRPLGRAAGLGLFLLPIVYVGGILAVAVHEVFGHGLSAVLLGGEFSGFVLKWDAMGWAFSALPPTAPPWHHVLYLASGIVATTICGGVLLGLVFLFRKRTDIQLALLILSFCCLMDGIPYLLWNSYHPVRPGDIGRIILLSCGDSPPELSPVRCALLGLGALLFAATTFHFCAAAFTRMEELILDGDQFTGRSRLLALFLLLVLPGSAAWFTFDWNQLAPGVGLLPCVVGALSIAAAAAVLVWYRPKSTHEAPVPPITWRHIVLSWTCLIVTVMALGWWFQDGIMWG